jgi:hypothetical protein
MSDLSPQSGPKQTLIRSLSRTLTCRMTRTVARAIAPPFHACLEGNLCTAGVLILRGSPPSFPKSFTPGGMARRGPFFPVRDSFGEI